MTSNDRVSGSASVAEAEDLAREEFPPTTAGGRDEVTIVDRRAEVIGTAAMTGRMEVDPLTVEVTETLGRLSDVDGGTITVPADMVAAIRRDKVRLSVSIHDQLFRARLLDDPPERLRESTGDDIADRASPTTEGPSEIPATAGPDRGDGSG